MGHRPHTARANCLPFFMLESASWVQRVKLSRETMVLSRNNQNGYIHEFKRWKFFRAKAADELWQIDFKGPFTVQDKKHWFLVCVDDYSRFIVCTEQFDHELTTAGTAAVLEKLGRLPKAILSDHGAQFKEQLKGGWCWQHGVEAYFAHSILPAG